MRQSATRPGLAVGALLGSLAVFDVVRRVWIPGGADFLANVTMIGVLAGLARANEVTVHELGLARTHAWRGLRIGLMAFGVVAAVVALGAIVSPGVRDALRDQDPELSAVRLLVRVLVVIPIGTVVLEELAFRGLLLALLDRVTTPRRSACACSAAFAVWHLPGVIGSTGGSTGDGAGARVVEGGAALVLTTLVSTALAGAVMVWLRRRSGHLLAPALAHLATNTVALVAAWVLTR